MTRFSPSHSLHFFYISLLFVLRAGSRHINRRFESRRVCSCCMRRTEKPQWNHRRIHDDAKEKGNFTLYWFRLNRNIARSSVRRSCIWFQRWSKQEEEKRNCKWQRRKSVTTKWKMCVTIQCLCEWAQTCALVPDDWAMDKESNKEKVERRENY